MQTPKTETSHADRLAAEADALRQLCAASTLFTFEATGDPPDRFALTFRGRGLAREVAANARVELTDVHRIELRLPFSFPQSPPDVRWLTPIFHPNVSYSGFIHFKEIGITWDAAQSLASLVERLWDVARFEYLDLEKASNYTAKNWFRDQHEFELPIDPRPLRDGSQTAANIIHYERRDGGRLVLPRATSGEVMYIGDDTPTPATPRRTITPSRRPASDDDVLFIGDE